MNIVYVATVKVGYSPLKTLYENGVQVDLLVTLPPSKTRDVSGYVDFSPLAEKNNTRVFYTEDINQKESVDAIKNTDPDLIIVCGWQKLLKKEVLDLPSKGCVGFHSSLLPKYRGKAPVNWAIIMGEKETGVTMFYLDELADAGDMIGQRAFEITFTDDCASIYDKSEKAVCDLLLTHLPKIEDGTVKRIHNPSRSYPAYPKRTPKDGLIDFNRPAVDVYNWIRAMTKPYPGAFFLDNGKKVMVWKAKLGEIPGEGHMVKQTLDIPITLVDWEVRDA